MIGKKVRSSSRSTSVAVVVANYRNELETVAFCNRLLNVDRHAVDIHLYIVDNSASEKNVAWDSLLWHCALPTTVLCPEGNLGYLGAARLVVARYFEGCAQFPQVLVLCNTDMTLVDRELFTKIAHYSRADDLAGVAPAVISDLTGSDQNPQEKTKPSRAKMRLLSLFFSNYLTFHMYSLASTVLRRVARRGRPEQQRGPTQIYAPHGSFIVLFRAYFERGGHLRLPLLLFGEVFHLAEQAKANNLHFVYDPGIVVRHNEHAVTGRFKNRKIVALHRAAAKYILGHYYGR